MFIFLKISGKCGEDMLFKTGFLKSKCKTIHTCLHNANHLTVTYKTQMDTFNAPCRRRKWHEAFSCPQKNKNQPQWTFLKCGLWFQHDKRKRQSERKKNLHKWKITSFMRMTISKNPIRGIRIRIPSTQPLRHCKSTWRYPKPTKKLYFFCPRQNFVTKSQTNEKPKFLMLYFKILT